MRKLLFLLATLSLSTLAVAGTAPDYMQKAVKEWQPLSVEFDKSALKIVLPQDQITPKIFETIISAGICSDVYDAPKKWDQVKEITVLNRHGHQGMVFEGGGKECMEYGELNAEQGKGFVIGKSHMK